ncbi:MAG TPA: J domain-containing protein [Pyrinomonadaceae bacterium]
MNTDKAYELLGVKPGVSNRELKAAHRDLAKVWHPDRFLHDPRLQEKAQEKLKEINEAYELLISGKTPRPRPAAQTAYATATPKRATPRRTNSAKWVAVPLFVFIAVFAITTRTLLQRHQQVVLPEPETVSVDQNTSARPDSNSSRSDSARKPNREESATEVVSAAPEPPPSVPTAALETVTVTIDPESGLLAKPECRVRSRMTYPRGSEPTGYCNINHTPPPKESRIKSITKAVRSL